MGDTTDYRVIFAGPVGVGKTTAVRTLSTIAPSETEAPLTALTTSTTLPPDKTTTTVGIDYGVWKPRPGLSVALIGTPGQGRFAQARASLMAPWTRVVLWLFGDRQDLGDQARRWFDTLGDPALRRCVIAVTRVPDGGERAGAVLAPLLHDRGATQVPVLGGDPREGSSVLRIVSTALDLPEESS